MSIATCDDDNSPKFNFIRTIGNGCFGYVFEVQDLNFGTKYALKRIEKVGSILSRELEILQKIKHLDNVINLELIFYSRSDNRLVQNLVFDYVEDNLQNLMERTRKSGKLLPEQNIKNYAYQLLNGLKNIHNINIAHRDLKPENVLLSKEGFIKICDFGSSKIMNREGKNTPYMVSRYYRAPELIMCITNYTESIDIWATACIIMELYTLDPTFKGKNEGDQIFSIFAVIGGLTLQDKKFYKGKVPFQKQIIDQMAYKQGQDLEKKFHMSNDKDNLIDLLRKMLSYNYETRISAKQAMKHPYFDSVRAKQDKNYEDKGGKITKAR